MKFTKLPLEGAYKIELEAFSDERGTFSRHYCKNELAEHGIEFDICQTSISKNFKAGVLRGIHTTRDGYPEGKIVTCIKGSIFDIIVDLRKDSNTYLQWLCFELTEDSNYCLYIPPYFGHGFQTLEDNTTVYYQMDTFFDPNYYDGVRWDDPKINIEWPSCDKRIISDKDKAYKLL